VRFILPFVLCLPIAAASPPSLLDILSDELQRNFTILKQKADPPPYYLSYTVTEEESQVISASLGTLTNRSKGQVRYLDITLRVGNPKLDNYHVTKGGRVQFTPGAIVPLDDVADAIRRRAWLETDASYRRAAGQLIEIKSNAQSKVQQEDDSNDFSSESPAVH
jgi:TldD protein